MIMNTTFRYIFILLFCSLMLTGCELVGDIFKAGMWVGIVIVLIVIGLIFYLVKKVF